MTRCPMCGQLVPVQGCAEHIALCGLDDATLAEIMATQETATDQSDTYKQEDN